MSIIVIDQAPELFWFVSSALLQEEIPLKHVQTLAAGEKSILQELPEIVIINGDDKTLLPEQFISRMRNHVFARNTMFIVCTADTSFEFKKALLMAGAGQVFYRGRGFDPSPKFFASLVKWFLNHKEPDPQIFDHKPVAFHADGEFTTFGRIGWINSTHCLVEANINLNVGQEIEISNTLFDELEIKDVRLECVEKNKVGRYYQYTHSLLCKIQSKDPIKDAKKISSWVENNRDISKHKSIKVVYFESDPDYRDEIRKMIHAEKKYCARGYASIDNILEVMNYQLPQLVLINRDLISADKTKFDPIKNFLKTNFCYCVTYSNTDTSMIEEFKKDYEFAMHSPTPINIDLLESMIQKLEQKLPDHLKSNSKKVYFNKHSAYSRFSLYSPCKLYEISQNSTGIILPFQLSNFTTCEVTSNAFSIAKLPRTLYFKSFTSKQTTKGINHRLIFMGQTIKESEYTKAAVDKINEFGFDRWVVGDTASSDKKK